MNELAWVFLGTFAAASTFQALRTPNDQLAIITGLMGAVAWSLFAFFALGIDYPLGDGTTVTKRYPSLAAFGLMMAAPNLFVALTGPLELVGDNDELRKEVGG